MKLFASDVEAVDEKGIAETAGPPAGAGLEKTGTCTVAARRRDISMSAPAKKNAKPMSNPPTISVCREVVAATVGAGAGCAATREGASVVAGEGTGGAEAWAGEDSAIATGAAIDALGEAPAIAGVVCTTGD
jgi:hypothetical protein